MKLLPKITSQILFFFVITGCDKTNITVQTVPVIAGTPPIPAEYISQPKISESQVQFIKQNEIDTKETSQAEQSSKILLSQ